MYLLTNLLSNAYGLGKKQEKMMKAAFMAVAVLATVNFAFPGVFAAPDLAKVVGMVLGIIYVIMVFVGIFLLVTNIMSFATADADNGPARTKATYGMAGGGLLIILPAVLTIFPFAQWVTEQIQDLLNV
mgnify:FL=1|jgi:hypothetical protein